MSNDKYMYENKLYFFLLRVSFACFLREAAKKGDNGRAIKEKRKLFLEPFFQRSKVSPAIKLERGGGLGLNSPGIKRRTFCAASLREDVIIYFHS